MVVTMRTARLIVGALCIASCGGSAATGSDGGARDAPRGDASHDATHARDAGPDAAHLGSSMHDAKPASEASSHPEAGHDAPRDVTHADSSSHDAMPHVDASDAGPRVEAGRDGSRDGPRSEAATDASDAGSLCNQACEHATACGDNACEALGINCATLGASDQCLFTCLLGIPCADLGATAVQGCQSKCGDAGTDSGSTSVTCSACAAQSCTAPAGACAQDVGCRGWLTCVDACQSAGSAASCFTACDTQYASASGLYEPVYACECTSCDTPCAAAAPCTR
jgi:hypothetical protein